MAEAKKELTKEQKRHAGIKAHIKAVTAEFRSAALGTESKEDLAITKLVDLVVAPTGNGLFGCHTLAAADLVAALTDKPKVAELARSRISDAGSKPFPFLLAIVAKKTCADGYFAEGTLGVAARLGTTDITIKTNKFFNSKAQCVSMSSRYKFGVDYEAATDEQIDTLLTEETVKALAQNFIFVVA